MFSGIALTLYDYLLVFNDEVRQQSSTPFAPVTLLTHPSRRFGMSGEVVRRGVRSVIVHSVSRELTNKPCDSLLPLYPGEPSKIFCFSARLLKAAEPAM